MNGRQLLPLLWLSMILLTLQVVNSQKEEAASSCGSSSNDETATLSDEHHIYGDSDGAFAIIPLPGTLTNRMVDYIDERGIYDWFETVFERGNSSSLAADELAVRGYHWWMERPTVGLHKLAPENEIAYQEFLAALKEGGLDGILERIGKHLEWDSLSIYQATIYGFWGDMQSNETTLLNGNNTNAVELIIPLLLPVAGVDMRFQLESYDDVGKVGTTYRHEKNSAVLVRDAYTQSIQEGDEDMLLAISLVMGEITSTSMESILQDLNETRYPDRDYLTNFVHWNRTNASVALPEPIKRAGDFVLVKDIQPSQIEPIRWAGNPNEAVAKYAFQIGLPDELMPTLLQYCDEMGITNKFKDLVVHGNPLRPGREVAMTLRNLNWYIQRPDWHWHSNMHWISPLDKESQDDYLKVLSKGGFDKVLEAIGNRFNLKGLVAYHITFIGVSHCAQGFDHYDFTGTGGRGFNVIIPLILADDDDTPELDLSNDLASGSYKYQYGIASMVGDEVNHATAAVDYRAAKQMRMAATVYVADIQKSNIDSIMEDYTQKYPPKGDYAFLLSLAGTHWKRGNATVRLPTYDASVD